MVNLLHNQKVHEVQSEADLVTFLQAQLQSADQEIWLSGHGSTSFCILSNGELAFMMYLRYDGDSGFSSRSSSQPSDAMVAFKLANGQMDEYPAGWLVPLELAWKVATEYFQTGSMSTSILWVEE